MKNVKFIAHYDTVENDGQKRSVALSACNKIQSVLNGLKSLDCTVEVVSIASTYGEEDVPAKSYCTKDGTWIRLFYAIGRRKYLRIMNRIIIPLQALAYLVCNVRKYDIVFAYHSMATINLLYLLKLLTGCKLVLEMEEIYGDVSGRENWRRRELRFAKIADAYIFPTQLLDDLVNKDKKPSVIIHGTYQAEQDRKCNIFADELHKKIHCIYAGTFDPRKGGATAAAAAEYLPENYHIHILGFGSEMEKKNMQELIGELSQKCACTITYDGLLSGDEYIRFVQSCDIGLSTQNPDAAFNVTSFPSKILSYMANGLRVVSVRIPAIEGSAIGEYMYYYDQQTPEEIAKAIMKVDINDDYDGREIIADLNVHFKNNLKELLKNEFTPN